MKAKLIKRLEISETGATQELYRLSPSLSGHRYAVASSVDVPMSGPEVLLFPADEHGKVLDWGEIGGRKGTLSIEQTLLDEGYAITEEDLGRMSTIDNKLPSDYRPVGFMVATDSFMSGWGGAAGGTSYFAVACEAMEQTDSVERRMADRNDFKRVRFAKNLPRRGFAHMSVIPFEGFRYGMVASDAALSLRGEG